MSFSSPHNRRCQQSRLTPSAVLSTPVPWLTGTALGSPESSSHEHCTSGGSYCRGLNEAGPRLPSRLAWLGCSSPAGGGGSMCNCPRCVAAGPLPPTPKAHISLISPKGGGSGAAGLRNVPASGCRGPLILSPRCRSVGAGLLPSCHLAADKPQAVGGVGFVPAFSWAFVNGRALAKGVPSTAHSAVFQRGVSDLGAPVSLPTRGGGTGQDTARARNRRLPGRGPALKRAHSGLAMSVSF